MSKSKSNTVAAHAPDTESAKARPICLLKQVLPPDRYSRVGCFRANSPPSRSPPRSNPTARQRRKSGEKQFKRELVGIQVARQMRRGRDVRRYEATKKGGQMPSLSQTAVRLEIRRTCGADADLQRRGSPDPTPAAIRQREAGSGQWSLLPHPKARRGLCLGTESFHFQGWW